MSDQNKAESDEAADGARDEAGATSAGATSAGATSPQSGAAQLNDRDNRLKLVATHLLVAMAVLAMWAAADAWQAVTGLAMASLLSVSTAFVAGLVLGTQVHEWCHFAGARIAGARYTVPGKPGLFVFNFDFAHNSAKQFLVMSYGGQIGGVLAALLLWLAVPTDTAGRAMLIAAAAGAAVFAGAIEWPVIRRTRVSGNPAAELGRIDRDALYASALKGLVATAVIWLVLR